MSAVAALIVRPDGTAEIRDVEPDLASLQGLVGGYIESIEGTVPNTPTRWHAYVDEDGRSKALPVSEAASSFARSLGWRNVGGTLRGPVVFLGEGPDGSEADVPPEVVGEAVRLWGLND